jgi:hypothetical protein
LSTRRKRACEKGSKNPEGDLNMRTITKLAVGALMASGVALAAAAPAEAGVHVGIGVGVPVGPAYYGGGYGPNYCYGPYADPGYCGYPGYWGPGYVGFGWGGWGHGYYGRGGWGHGGWGRGGWGHGGWGGHGHH